jgi:hypothetical protein
MLRGPFQCLREFFIGVDASAMEREEQVRLQCATPTLFLFAIQVAAMKETTHFE